MSQEDLIAATKDFENNVASGATAGRVAARHIEERLAAADPLKKVIAKAEDLVKLCDKIISAARGGKQTLINNWSKKRQIEAKAKLLTGALIAARTRPKGPPKLRDVGEDHIASEAVV